jgi:hypothetical protein
MRRHLRGFVTAARPIGDPIGRRLSGPYHLAGGKEPMKKLLAMLLSLVMVFAFVSVTAADDADFTLVIKGGDVNENTVPVNGEQLLKVDVALNGTVEDTLLTLTFALTYDPGQITFVNLEKDDAFNMAVVNDVTPGTLRITMTSEGVKVTEETAVAALYFKVAENLEAGAEIALGLLKDAVAETYADNASVVTAHDIAADFAPYTVSEEEITVESIEIVPPEKKEYQIGEELDLTGGKIKVVYSNGTEETVDLTADMVEGFSSEKAGVCTLTVTYEGKTATFDVTILGPEFTGIVKFNEGEVEYKGETPYVIWNHEAGKHEPAFTVYEEDGETVIAPENYDFEYKENTMPGTGYLFVYFKGAYSGEAMLSFKIYLPATTETYVENVENGIKVTWAPVEDAAGYVIYRRAWSTTTDGWTAFARWDNTTALEYLDGHDEAHKTFAGTRYQYGVKAYFARRTDPIAQAEIGGNVNEPSGNFNLGMVGPLKTTVRITTRKLVSVTAGSKQMTVKWEPSKNFTGYQIKYATDAKFTKDVKAIKITNPATAQTVIKSLTSGKTYYVVIRSYHEFDGMTYYGGWSEAKNCKVK